jgi:hypothetical protein
MLLDNDNDNNQHSFFTWWWSSNFPPFHHHHHSSSSSSSSILFYLQIKVLWKPPSTPFLLLILKHISQTPFSSDSQFCKNPEGDRDQRVCLCHMSWELRGS